VVCASFREAKTDVATLTDSEEEIIIIAAEQNTPLVAGTWSGQQYLKKYDEAMASSSKLIQEPVKQSTKQPVEKQKEFAMLKLF